VKCVDEKLSASLHRSYSYDTSPASDKDTAEFLQQQKELMKPLLEEAGSLPFAPGELDPTNAQVHEVCCNYGKTFIDKEFPPSIASLFKPSTELSEGEMSGAEPTKRSSVVWRRASDFLEGDYAVFDEGIGPHDIRQGALGDCWFLCAVSALAEFPVLIRDIVETNEANGDGCYRVKFCKNGGSRCVWMIISRAIRLLVPCIPSRMGMSCG